MSNGPSVNEQVARLLVQVMVQHGVASVRNSLGRAGSLTLRPGGGVVHFGLNLTWLTWQNHEKLWQAVGLPGDVQLSHKDEEAFFNDLMSGFRHLGVGRVVWTDETRVLFTRDESAPSGLGFQLRELECLPPETQAAQVDIHFQA